MDQSFQELGLSPNLSNVLLLWALMMGRIMPLIVFAPFIGGDIVPSQVKMGVGIALTILLYPFVADTQIPIGAITFVLLLLKEVFIGLAVAFAATMAFEAARAAGTFVDTVSGANMATVFVPQIQQQATLFSDFKFQLTIVVFLGLNGHHLVIEALFHSFELIPLNEWPKFGHGFWPFFNLTIRMTAEFLVIAIALAAPAALATFIADLALGLVNRVAPQIQVFFISMAIKPVLVVLVTLVALTALYDRFHSMFKVMIRHVQDVVVLFS